MKNITLLLLFCSTFLNAQLPDPYIINQVNSGFDYSMQSVFHENFTITAERDGNIFVSEDNVKREDPIVVRTPDTVGEGGLLSILYSNGDLWVYNTEAGTPKYGNISRYTLDLEANTSVFQGNVLSEFFLYASNHQGGTLMMDSEGWLYCSFGDAVNKWHAQRDSRLNGKIVRINAITGAGHPDNPLYNANNPFSAESRTYAKGMRNPFRCFMKDDVIYVFDVGSQSFEEATIITEAGKNLGYPFYEGFEAYVGSVPTNPDTGNSYVLENYLEPIFALDHATSGMVLPNSTVLNFPFTPVSIIGGAILDNFGYPNGLLFMDVFKQNLLIAILNDNNEVVELVDLGDIGFQFVTHATQFDSKIYITRSNGEIFEVSYDETLSNNDVDFNYIDAQKTYWSIGHEKFVSKMEINTPYIIYYKYQNRTKWKKRIYTSEASLFAQD